MRSSVFQADHIHQNMICITIKNFNISSRRASFSWLNHQIEHSHSTQLIIVGLMTTFRCPSDILLTSCWLFTTRWCTWPRNKWSPGRHSDKPDGSKRHFGLGRPRHAWIGKQDPTNSATHGTRWFLGHVHRRVVDSRQDVNSMSDGHRNVVNR